MICSSNFDQRRIMMIEIRKSKKKLKNCLHQQKWLNFYFCWKNADVIIKSKNFFFKLFEFSMGIFGPNLSLKSFFCLKLFKFFYLWRHQNGGFFMNFLNFFEFGAFWDIWQGKFMTAVSNIVKKAQK